MRNINEKLRKLTGSIESDLSKLLDKRFTTFLAKKAQEIIYKRVKSGYGVSKKGKQGNNPSIYLCPKCFRETKLALLLFGSECGDE